MPAELADACALPGKAGSGLGQGAGASWGSLERMLGARGESRTDRYPQPHLGTGACRQPRRGPACARCEGKRQAMPPAPKGRGSGRKSGSLGARGRGGHHLGCKGGTAWGGHQCLGEGRSWCERGGGGNRLRALALQAAEAREHIWKGETNGKQRNTTAGAPARRPDGPTGWLGSENSSLQAKATRKMASAPASIKPSLWAACDGGDEDHGGGTGWGRGEMPRGHGRAWSSKLGVFGAGRAAGVDEELQGPCTPRRPLLHLLRRRRAPGGSQPPTLAPAAQISSSPASSSNSKLPVYCNRRVRSRRISPCASKGRIMARAWGGPWLSTAVASAGRTGRVGCRAPMFNLEPSSVPGNYRPAY